MNPTKHPRIYFRKSLTTSQLANVTEEQYQNARIFARDITECEGENTEVFDCIIAVKGEKRYYIKADNRFFTALFPSNTKNYDVFVRSKKMIQNATFFICDSGIEKIRVSNIKAAFKILDSNKKGKIERHTQKPDGVEIEVIITKGMEQENDNENI